MNEIFNGWQYIRVLFDCLSELNQRLRKDRIVEPRYIFRGVTQRFFTSSPVINSYLEKNLEEFERLCKLENIDFSNVINCVDTDRHHDYVSALRNCARRFYFENLKKLNRFFEENSGTDEDALKVLKDVIGLSSDVDSINLKDAYQFVKPRYIRSGAAVRLFPQQNRTQSDYIAYHRNLIAEMRSRYPLKYKDFSELELLAELQHNGGATCLVDFSTNFLISLWFATQDYARNNNEMGYLYCYDVNVDSIERNNLVILNSDKEKRSIEELISDTQIIFNDYGDSSTKFFLWKPSSLNNRIARQDSIFVFGIEKFEIEDHPIFVLPIPSHWKGPIQRVLKYFFGITGETLYDDSDGVATANDKINPLRPQTQYFNESVVNKCVPENLKFKSFDLLQKGTSFLLKGKYDLSLEFFCAFEGTNVDQIDRIKTICNNDSSEEDDIKLEEPQLNNLRMIIVELAYSKGLCLRRLSQINEAILSYKTAFDNCISLFQSMKIPEIEKVKCDYVNQEKTHLLHNYVFDKLFKIIRGYIYLLYDTKSFKQIRETLDCLIKSFVEMNLDIPMRMTMMVYTTYNEALILEHLNKVSLKEEEYTFKKITDDLKDDTLFYPYCSVINVYFELIKTVLDNLDKEECFFEDLDLFKSLTSQIEVAIKTQSLQNDTLQVKDVFTGWLFNDIKDSIKDRMKEKTDARDFLYKCTALVEDCRRQIEGRKRQSVY